MKLERLQIVPTLRARWRRVVFTWAAVVAAVLAVTLALPPRYEATATLVAELGGTDPIRGQAVFKPAGAVSTHVATQVDVIRSEEVALGALRALKLHESPAWKEAWQDATGGEGHFESWIAEVLLRKFSARPSRESNVITLSYTSDDPGFSAAVVNAFIQSYQETTLRMQVGPARLFNTFFEERAKPLRAALEEARARLSAYEKKHGILIAENEDSDVESKRLSDLTSAMVTLQDELAQSVNRRRQAAAAPSNMEELRRDPEVLALTAELAKQEGKLSELRSAFGEQHPAVVETREAAKVLRKRVDGAMRQAATSFESPLKVNEARMVEMQRALERQRAVVMDRKSRRDAATSLVRDVQNAQKAYDAVLERASQTALEGANTTLANVSVVKAATPPRASSMLLLNTCLAVLLGLLLGIARALFKESRDRRVRTMEDVSRWLQQPMLLTLPNGRAMSAQTANRSLENRQRLVAVKSRFAALR